MDRILLRNNTEVFTDNRIQVGSIGRPFQCAGVRKNEHFNGVWRNKTEYFYWIYTFRYVDNRKEGFDIEIDYQNNFVKIVVFE